MVEIRNIEGLPQEDILDDVCRLLGDVFSSSPVLDIVARTEGKKAVLFSLAYDSGRIVGCKIGFERRVAAYYSWLGGVALPGSGSERSYSHRAYPHWHGSPRWTRNWPDR